MLPWITDVTHPLEAPRQGSSALLQKLDLDWELPPPSVVAGRTASCTKVTTSRWVLDTIVGYLVGRPVQSHQPTTVLQQDDIAQMNREIESLLDKRAVMKVNHPAGGFYSTMFLVPKKTETSDKPKVTQQVCESPSFQDGGNACGEGFDSAKRLANSS